MPPSTAATDSGMSGAELSEMYAAAKAGNAPVAMAGAHNIQAVSTQQSIQVRRCSLKPIETSVDSAR